MIFTKTSKRVRVMLTTFRDGLQSSFGGKVRLQDFLPAMKASVEAGIRHFEFGGGARFQAPLFYLGEDPFDTMLAIRDAVGPDVILQILTRSVSGVTLTTQSIEGLHLQARLMKEAGTTWDRNFDYMNDVRNLVDTGRPIVEAGMHHQAAIALMGLPFQSDVVHTAEFYIDIGRQLLKSDVRIDSLCLKDASGTCDPKTIYTRTTRPASPLPATWPASRLGSTGLTSRYAPWQAEPFSPTFDPWPMHSRGQAIRLISMKRKCRLLSSSWMRA
jgi:pyruvate carboxylase subunit B